MRFLVVSILALILFLIGSLSNSAAVIEISDDGASCESQGWEWNSDLNMCSMTSDLIGDTVVVTSDWVILDGNNHKIECPDFESSTGVGWSTDEIHLHIRVQNTEITNCDKAIMADPRDGTTEIFGNNIHHNRYGIDTFSSLETFIENNVIINNDFGIYHGTLSEDITAIGNTISSNSEFDLFGIIVSGDGLFYHNNFGADFKNGIVLDTDIWYRFLPIGGNHWEDFDEPSEGCHDVSPANGFCDSAFLANPPRSFDRYPWIIPSGWSAKDKFAFPDCLIGVFTLEPFNPHNPDVTYTCDKKILKKLWERITFGKSIRFCDVIICPPDIGPDPVCPNCKKIILGEEELVMAQKHFRPLQQFKVGIPPEKIVPSEGKILLISDGRDYPISVSKKGAMLLIDSNKNWKFFNIDK